MSLLARSATLDAPRHDIDKKHELPDLLFPTVRAALSGAAGRADIKQSGDDKLSG